MWVMNNIKLLIFSDIHLEKSKPENHGFLLSSINSRVEEVKKMGFTPLVICAGDLHNSSKGYDFLSKINTNVIYIAGNHEFWGGDYDEIIEELKIKKPKNVTFLHNQFLVVGQYVILASTLWTDVGINLNKDLLFFAANRMNDMSYIKAKNWYEDEKNLERLNAIYSGYLLEERIESKSWNVFVEIDKNREGWNFINHSGSVLSVIHKVSKISQQIQEDLIAQDEWDRIDKKTFNEIKEKINLLQKDLSWSDFVYTLAELHATYAIEEDERDELLKDSLEKDKIFQQMRFLDGLNQKEIVVLSHHLPFYEEILVGTHEQNANQDIKLCNEIDESLFLVRHGTEYPEANYLFKALEGGVDRKKDVTHIVNYYNDGANRLNKFLLNNAKLWVHGHEHHFKYRGHVKGIQIVANPVGSYSSILDSSSGKLSLSKHYVAHHQIKPAEFDSEISKIKRSILAEPLDNSFNVESAVKLWALKHYDWEEHEKCLRKIDRAAKEVLLLSIQYIKAKRSQGSTDLIEEKIGVWHDSYNFNCQKLNKLHNKLFTAINVRLDRNFNFQSHLTQLIKDNRFVYSLTMGNASPPEVIDSENIDIFNAQNSFEAKGHIKIALSYSEKLREFLNSMKCSYVHEVRQEDINNFHARLQSAISEERIKEKIDEKWDLFYQKTFNGGEIVDDDF